MNTKHSSVRGFTLIELLVVIAILGLLASIIFAQLAVARTKAVDTRKKADMASLRTAIRSFHLDKGRMPHNYNCSGGTCRVDDDRPTIAIEDTTNPENPTTESGRAFKASMQELITGRYLPQLPHSPGGAGYAYYDYGPGSVAGAIIGTSLDAETPSAAGVPGSCRPFAPISTAPASQQLAAVGGGGWQTCLVEEDGVLVERRCPANGGGGGGAGPIRANICSTVSSKDYCLCSSY